MSTNEPMRENGPLFLMAGLACLMCLPIVYLATRPVIWWIHVSWISWPLLLLFIIVPLSVTFAVLYWSAWHSEWPRIRRIAVAAFSSCVIFGVDLIFVVFLIIGGILVASIARVMGGN